MSLRKSSRRRNGSKSEVLPKPNARRRCTPAPSRVGLDLMSRFTGRMDIITLLLDRRTAVADKNCLRSGNQGIYVARRTSVAILFRRRSMLLTFLTEWEQYIRTKLDKISDVRS